MYIPAHNRETDRAKIIAFMRAYPFVTLITARDGHIQATHLPTLIEECGTDLVLVAHVAKGNSQWHDLPGQAALVIFQEPHAFISTQHYERPLSVPTWNYVAVHAYGEPRLLESVGERLNVVERMVAQFEGTLERWINLPDDFKQAKANGIVAFEIPVARLEARFKLSQDRTRTEQENIIAALGASPNDLESTIGAIMQERLEE